MKSRGKNSKKKAARKKISWNIYRTGGGFEKEEVEEAISKGIKPISLGKRILRTETAGNGNCFDYDV